jgi:hypothetical protein
MILVDANLLLYAYNSSSEHHHPARRWWEAALSKPRQPVALAWVTILAFLRISTNPRAFPSPYSPAEAASFVSEWLAVPTVGVLNPGERHWQILSELLPAAQVRGALVTDAHLAALAIEHGAVLCTTDRDFTRFTGLKTANPLLPPDITAA